MNPLKRPPRLTRVTLWVAPDTRVLYYKSR